jgi:hypothetical protein
VREHFSWQRTTDLTLAVYDDVRRASSAGT